MKKVLSLVLVAVLVMAALAGCGQTAENGSAAAGGETVTIKVGATPTPHAEILNALKPVLAEEGVDLEVVEYTDYVIPNTAVESGELDANYFQHLPYLEDFNAENGTHLASVLAVHYEPM
ncbi:MAG: MetQ/NlpA family ABC transporter substrate-binding protein, partial [Anaerovoracaceae bacterium]